MANVHIRFNDDIDNYEQSDSEDEYNEREKALLKKARKKSNDNSDSEEEVYNLNSGSSSSDENENADSDIDKADDDDDLPDVRAWGKRKRDFYSTDYVDQDFGGFQGKDATEAEFEENEAKEIQKRLAEQLDDEDFSLDIFNKKQVQEVAENTEIIKSDLSSLSKRELQQLLQKESPEMFMLIDDCKLKMERVKSFLYPIILKVKQEEMEECEAVNFVKALYQMTLNYCTNVSMYLLLKASKSNIPKHPVLKRLYQYRQLIAQLEPIYDEIIQPQIEVILNTTENEEITKTQTIKKVKKLKLLQNLDKLKTNPEEDMQQDKTELPAKKIKSILHSKKSVELEQSVNSDDSQDDEQIEEQKEKSDVNEEEETGDVKDSKRAITYQMQKNKGLTPHRKKEQRNPRVKHRNKFRKANIRRKGAVREVRKELSRYGGEISGIKTTVSKSIKFK